MVGFWTRFGFALSAPARALFQRLLFPAPRMPLLEAGDVTPFERVTSDGVVARSYEVGTRSHASTELVYFHGNGETVASVLPMARTLADLGFVVTLVEYRGYGTSRRSGSPSEAGLYADAEAALDGLVARGIDLRRVALWGSSLGTAVATEMASRGRCGALVLAMPFTSAVDLCKVHAPMLRAEWVVTARFESLAKAPAIAVPTLILHGAIDRLVPPWMGRAIGEAIAGATFVELPGVAHADFFARGGDDVVRRVTEHVKGALTVTSPETPAAG